MSEPNPQGLYIVEPEIFSLTDNPKAMERAKAMTVYLNAIIASGYGFYPGGPFVFDGDPYAIFSKLPPTTP